MLVAMLCTLFCCFPASASTHKSLESDINQHVDALNVIDSRVFQSSLQFCFVIFCPSLPEVPLPPF